MLIRKNISLDEKYLKKLQPLLEKNEGNLSAAIRDTIDLTDTALKNHENIEKSMEILTTRKTTSTKLEELIESGENIIVNHLTLRWLLDNSKGRIIDDELVNELINPFAIQTMSELDEYLNNLSQDFEWKIEVSIFCMDQINPETATIVFSNGDSNLREFFAEHVALFVAQWKQLDIDDLYKRSKSIRIDFKRTDQPEDIPPGIKKHFGNLDVVCKEIDQNPAFWSKLVTAYKAAGYNMVTIPKNQFEDFAAGEVADAVGIFEALTKKPIKEIPLPELLSLFKNVFPVLQIVDSVEIQTEPENESIKIHHNYRNEKAISKMIQYFSKIFEANGHEFEVNYSSSFITFEKTK